MSRHRIFTVTAGRTGTDWLAALIRDNSGNDCISVHEYYGVDDFGTKTPDIRTLRHFNTYGMTPVVDRFWKHKIASLPDVPVYFESSHPLAKAGLIEALARYAPNDRITILLLRRNWQKQVMSYLNRGDFSNLTLLWQWYLDPAYPRRLVDPSRAVTKGMMGRAIWYCAEVEARQEYYRALYGDRFRFIDCRLEQLTEEDGARGLLETLGFSGQVSLPPKRNASAANASNESNQQRVAKLLSNARFDASAAAHAFIKSGARLDKMVEDPNEAKVDGRSTEWVPWKR